MKQYASSMRFARLLIGVALVVITLNTACESRNGGDHEEDGEDCQSI